MKGTQLSEAKSESGQQLESGHRGEEDIVSLALRAPSAKEKESGAGKPLHLMKNPELGARAIV